MQRGFIFTELLVAMILLGIGVGIGLRYLHASSVHSQSLYNHYQRHLNTSSEQESVRVKP